MRWRVRRKRRTTLRIRCVMMRWMQFGVHVMRGSSFPANNGTRGRSSCLSSLDSEGKSEGQEAPRHQREEREDEQRSKQE